MLCLNGQNSWWNPAIKRQGTINMGKKKEEKKKLKKLKKATKKADKKKGAKVDRSDIPINSPFST
jgi:hypothetical protein